MSKAVLISIHPEWCEKIANGQKTIEIRKNRPKSETPFKCYIYCTKNGRPLVFGDVPCADGWREEYTRTYGYSKAEVEKIWGAMNGQVIGEFVCDWIKDFGMAYDGKYSGIENIYRLSCLSFEEMYQYIGEGYGYCWHISNLVIYDKPKGLSDFQSASSVLSFGKDGQIEYTGLKRPPQSWCYVEEVR